MGASNNGNSDDGSSSAVSFGLVDDVCWNLVAQFAAPPDGMN